MVVKREYRLDILPLPDLWGNTRTTLLARARDHVVDNAQSFGFTQRLTCQGLLHFLVRLRRSNTVKPVLDPTNMRISNVWSLA